MSSVTHSNSLIYLDNAATTPVDPRVAAKMMEYLTQQGNFGNPASHHNIGLQAKEAVEFARIQVAALVNASSEAIIWTSGATESNNMAVRGAALFYKRLGNHIVTTQTEHRSVLDCCQALANEGFEITYLKPDKKGIISVEEVEKAIKKETLLVSIIHVNNETGVIQDIAAIGNMLRQKSKEQGQDILFHVDAAQSVGKIAINLQQLPIDLMSFTAHKIYGPKGIGALFVRNIPKVRLKPLLYGGGQEKGFRSGTLPTHQCVGMGLAYQIAGEEMKLVNDHISRLRDVFWNGIQDLPLLSLNGCLTDCLPNIINICFGGMDKEKMLSGMYEIALSSGSACMGSNVDTSHVLRAMGMRNELAHRSFRISFGRFTTMDEVNKAVSIICEHYQNQTTRA